MDLSRVKAAFAVLIGERGVGPIYPRHDYDLMTEKAATRAANERADRWMVRYQDSEKKFKELLKRVEPEK